MKRLAKSAMAGRAAALWFSLAVACLLGGCGGGQHAYYAQETVWPVPPEGSMIPAVRSLCVTREGEVVALDTIGRVLVYDAAGNLARKWRMPEYAVGRPESVTQIQDGSLLIADTHYHRVMRVSITGEVLGSWGSYGKGAGEFIYPVAVAQAGDGEIFVAEYGGNDRVQVFDAAGNYLRSFGSFGSGAGEFQRCSGLTVLGERIYIADAINNRIQVYTLQGEPMTSFTTAGGRPFRFPYDIAATADGNLAVVEYSNGCITIITPEGALVGRHGRVGTGTGHFATPWGIAAGADGRVFVADTGNHRIVMVNN